ncbi:MAG: hypothetical protein HWD61_10890 [Parachlamydiaceae bacterium]|nr:MAG: hypothetical protein HWD61_10890 [Parachlamydiaceae bacterium]
MSQILEKEDISGCFHQYSIEKYITVCRALVSKYQDPLDPTAERKLRAMMDDLIAKKTIDIWDYKQIEEIYTAIFNACSSVEQMIPMMQYNSGKIYLECPLGVIYEKGWIEEYVQKASLSLVKHYLTPKPILYFALKNAFIAQNKYEQLLEVLTEGQRDSMAIVTENEFKIPDPSRLPVELHTKVTDAHGNPIHVSIYDMHKNVNFTPFTS